MYLSDTTKYLIRINFHAEGVVDKSDIIGAIFGQTEGLLGEEMDLRDLQRSGRVGRIDVQIETKKGETRGEILITSSLDRAETAVLASALETIDRVGPCMAHFSVERIEDIRVTKKRKIVERAKDLLLHQFDESTIDTVQLLNEVRDAIRIEKVIEIGEEKVPAGPHVLDSDAVIIVEGRADVANLLRYGIKNAVAVEGTKVPAIIPRLAETRVTTAFLDGDRGGELILRELLQVADIDYIAYAPRGRSVEQMTRKEITKALRNKVPVEYVKEHGKPPEEAEVREAEKSQIVKPSAERSPIEAVPEKKAKIPHLLQEHFREVGGHTIARLLDGNMRTIGEFSAADIERVLDRGDGKPAGVVIDRVVDQKLLDLFFTHGIEFVAAPDFSGIIKRPTSVRLLKI
ncbi:MAG: DNA primase DnaG [Methanomicrobiales archaeon]|nr:DNA primase DnaG [Methanomicrobiales archaeon]